MKTWFALYIAPHVQTAATLKGSLKRLFVQQINERSLHNYAFLFQIFFKILKCIAHYFCRNLKTSLQWASQAQKITILFRCTSPFCSDNSTFPQYTRQNCVLFPLPPSFPSPVWHPPSSLHGAAGLLVVASSPWLGRGRHTALGTQTPPSTVSAVAPLQ